MIFDKSASFVARIAMTVGTLVVGCGTTSSMVVLAGRAVGETRTHGASGSSPPKPGCMPDQSPIRQGRSSAEARVHGAPIDATCWCQ